MLNVGQKVVVKSGITDPDFGFDISGWCGVIKEVLAEDGLFLVEWDKKTLSAVTGDVQQLCDDADLEVNLMYLEATDIEIVDAVEEQIEVLTSVNTENQVEVVAEATDESDEDVKFDIDSIVSKPIVESVIESIEDVNVDEVETV